MKLGQENESNFNQLNEAQSQIMKLENCIKPLSVAFSTHGSTLCRIQEGIKSIMTEQQALPEIKCTLSSLATLMKAHANSHADIILTKNKIVDLAATLEGLKQRPMAMNSSIAVAEPSMANVCEEVTLMREEIKQLRLQNEMLMQKINELPSLTAATSNTKNHFFRR